MFKNHPKGLYALALANTGERFGYYTMLAIFVLFLQAKFGLSPTQTGQIFGIFLGVVYFLPVIGGLIADNWLGYGKTVATGIVVMFLGYLLLAIPAMPMIVMIVALFIIALGTGLFKGNLQVLVGNLYDTKEFKDRRDPGFSLFYMAINLGAMFAPTAAEKVVGHFMGKASLFYNSQIPALAHQMLNGKITAQGTADLTALAAAQPVGITDLAQFSQLYIDKLAESYNYGFGVACVSLVVSMAIYLATRKLYKHADYNSKQLAAQANKTIVEPELSAAQTKKRIVALCLVFFVVIFFWMSFHQNGLTMTWFARDYTRPIAEGGTRMWFNVLNLVLMAIVIYGLFEFFQPKKAEDKTPPASPSDAAQEKKKRSKSRWISGTIVVVSIALACYIYSRTPDQIEFMPSIFQQFNPFFVVALTPLSIALFGYLNRKKKEPSTPCKIGIGMVVAALGFLILAVVSLQLKNSTDLKEFGGVSQTLVSPNWLISTYLVLTFAELFLSPMGISFVSKVAPPKFKGLMMGGWFAATAVGNYLTFIPASLWESGVPLWAVWGVLIALCLVSAFFIFAIMKRLENATK